MTSTALCATHPDRPATGACARCGTFICVGCTVSGDLCPDCRTRLHREGIPWTPQEKARASARRSLRRSRLSARVLAGSVGAGAATLLSVNRGWIPEDMRPVGWVLIGTAVVVGLVGAVEAARAWTASNQGRPGPALAGVVPGGTALALGAMGVAPVVAGLLAVLLG